MKSINDLIKNDPNINKEFKDMYGETKDEFKQAERLDDLKERYSHHNVGQLVDCLHLDHDTLKEINSKVLEDFQYYVDYPQKFESDYGDFDKYYKYLKSYIMEEYA